MTYKLNKTFGRYNQTDYRIMFFSCLLAGLLVIFPLLLPQIHANKNRDSLMEMISQITEGSGTNLLQVFGYNDYRDTSRNMFGSILLYCTGVRIRNNDDSRWGGIDETMHNMVDRENGTFYQTFKGFMTLLKAIGGLIFFARMTGMTLQKVIEGHDAVEAWLSAFIKMGIGLAVVFNADKIILFGFKVIIYIGKQVPMPSQMGDSTSNEALYTALIGSNKQNPGAFVTILAKIQLMIPWLFSYLISLATNFIIYQMLFEIGIRRVFLPLPIADTYQEGLRSPGVRYMKKLLAAVLKLVVCLVIIRISAEFMTLITGTASSEAGFLKKCFSIILVNLTSLGLMFKAGEYANDILGV